MNLVLQIDRYQTPLCMVLYYLLPYDTISHHLILRMYVYICIKSFTIIQFPFLAHSQTINGKER